MDAPKPSLSERLKLEVDDFKKLARERPSVALLLVVILIGVGSYYLVPSLTKTTVPTVARVEAVRSKVANNDALVKARPTAFDERHQPAGTFSPEPALVRPNQLMKNNTPDAASIQLASSTIRDFWSKHGVQQPLKFFGFCLSMLPIPAIQQAGQAMDRHFADKELRTELDRLWAEITTANKSLERIDTVEESIKAIAETLQSNASLLEASRQFAERLGTRQTEFKMLTEGRSYQELVGCVVVADIAQIIAKAESTNVVENSSIKASSTLLHASNNSQNFVRGTTFSGNEGSVKMDGITTKGNIVVSDSSVGFGPGSALIAAFFSQ